MATSAKDVASAGASPWGALATVGSSLIGSAYSASQARKEAQRNREFQERMSNTAHQREQADLRKAGLNPILSATKGIGASSPAGGMAQQPDLGMSSAKGVAAAAQLRLVDAQARNLNAQATNTELQEPMNKAGADVFSSAMGIPVRAAMIAGGAYGSYKTIQGTVNSAKRVFSRSKSKPPIRRKYKSSGGGGLYSRHGSPRAKIFRKF